MTTHTKLLHLMAACSRALPVAQSDVGREVWEQKLFASPEGMALVNAAFDLFESDDLYHLARDVEREIEPLQEAAE